MKTKMIVALLLLTGALSLTLGYAAPPKGAYKLSKKKSSFRIFVYKRGIASVFAHDHIIGVSDYVGSVDYRENAPEKSSVSIVVDASSLQVLDSELSEGDRKEVKENMDSDEVLSVKKHPKIRFKSTKVKLLTKTAIPGTKKAFDLRFKLSGTLELQAKKRSVELVVKVIAKGAELVTTGEFKIKQSDFGMKPFTAAWGTVGVKDEVELRFRLISRRP